MKFLSGILLIFMLQLVRSETKYSKNLKDSEIVVKAGEPVELKCTFEGLDVKDISWSRDHSGSTHVFTVNNQTVYQGQTLNIPSATMKDHGIYHCKGKNENGKVIHRIFELKVKHAPVIMSEESEIYQMIGYNINFQCDIYGYPIDSVTWLKNGVEIPFTDSDYIRSNFITGEGDDKITALLSLRPVKKEHYGVYKCKAVNKEGTAEKQIELKESKEPVHREE